MRRLGGAIGGLALVVAGTVAVPVAGAQEAGRTCNGKPVTIAFDDPGVGLTINGTEGPDVILGGRDSEVIKAGAGDDIVCGGEGADRINGGPGRDKLLGQGDSDSFSGGDLGLDQINGGSDRDVAGYVLLPAGVGVQVNTSNQVVHQDGAPVNGRIVSVETVNGTNAADVLVGGATSDRLFGREGDDVLDGRGDDDLLDGGPGRDRVTFATSTVGVQVNLLQQLARTAAGTEDTLSAIEGATGSAHADSLVGTGTDDELDGGGGDDKVKGKGGDDILLGGSGDDLLFPGPGDDFVDGGANDPVTSSGEHGDLVSYQGDTLDQGATHLEVVLYYFAPTNNPPYVSGVGEDTLSGIESARGVQHRQNTFAGTDGPNG